MLQLRDENGEFFLPKLARPSTTEIQTNSGFADCAAVALVDRKGAEIVESVKIYVQDTFVAWSPKLPTCGDTMLVNRDVNA